MEVSDQPRDQIDQEIDWAAMARVLDLIDVFELIIDGLNDGPLALRGAYPRLRLGDCAYASSAW